MGLVHPEPVDRQGGLQPVVSAGRHLVDSGLVADRHCGVSGHGGFAGAVCAVEIQGLAHHLACLCGSVQVHSPVGVVAVGLLRPAHGVWPAIWRFHGGYHFPGAV